MNVMRTLNNHNNSSTGSGQQATDNMHTQHIPVLLQEVLKNIELHKGDIVLDGTLGGGGHALAMAKEIGNKGTLIGIDVDSEAIKRVENLFVSHKVECGRFFSQNNFRNIDSVLNKLNIREVNAILFDLGLSSDQLEVSGRGFTFQKDEPLEMTLSNSIKDETLTAKEIVNTWQEGNLADIIYGYGEERYSRRIAKAIVEGRKFKEITTTQELVEIISRAVPSGYRHGKINPATKTFQALRITVNDELGAAREALDKAIMYLNQDGRVAVITFHSLEDRLVKRKFREWQSEGLGTVITKKPIIPSDEEIRINKRARSAKLRVFKKQ